MRHKSITEKIDMAVADICAKASENKMISVIIYANDDCRECLCERLNELGCKIKYEIDLINAVAADIMSSKIDELKEDEKIAFIAGDYGVKTCMDIARATVGADNTAYKGEGIGVAVIDTGLYPHADLTVNSPRIAGFVDFVNGKKKPYDDNGHGTHCAGIIASDGFASKGRYGGIAPKANIVGLKVMNAYGEGSVSDILASLQWVADNAKKYNIKVVSMSLGGRSAGRAGRDPMVTAVENLWNSGITVIAAAGNEGPAASTIGSPGVSRKIVTVGCSDDNLTEDYRDDFIADFSSRGPSPYSKLKPDVVAPGVNIMSLATNGGYTEMSGTSMATPIISGACALLYEKYPNIKPDEVKNRLIRSTNSLGQSHYAQGSGIIDLNKLLK